MSIDGTTAGILLSALQNGSSFDGVADLYKEIIDSTGGISAEDRAAVEKMIGKPCKIKYTSHVGKVIAVNEARGGFYGGSRDTCFKYLIKEWLKDTKVNIGA